MQRPFKRCWYGKCQYRGKAEFYLGTVEAESEMEAVNKLGEVWTNISPHPCPPILIAIPGIIIIHPDEPE